VCRIAEGDEQQSVGRIFAGCGLSPLAIAPAMTQANAMTFIKVSSAAFFISCFSPW
jgi:hypothetical protein